MFKKLNNNKIKIFLRLKFIYISEIYNIQFKIN